MISAQWMHQVELAGFVGQFQYNKLCHRYFGDGSATTKQEVSEILVICEVSVLAQARLLIKRTVALLTPGKSVPHIYIYIYIYDNPQRPEPKGESIRYHFVKEKDCLDEKDGT